MAASPPAQILQLLSAPATDSGKSSSVITATEAAAIFQKAARTWHNWNATGKVPRAIRVGRSVFWRREEIEAWFAAGCPDRETWEQQNRDQQASVGSKESVKSAR